MHLAIFRVRPDVGAVVHGHPSWATALATAGRGLEDCLLPEVVLGLGKVPLSRYATPGTDEVAQAVCEHITSHDAVLMPNHGVVACGPDPFTAFQTLETVERESILRALEHSRWNKTRAAKRLGISFGALRYRMQKIGLD